MLFWTRAILCIGTVTVLAIQHHPPGMPRPLPSVAMPSASALAAVACRARPDLCAAAAARGMGTLGPGVADSLLHAALSPSGRNGGHERRSMTWPGGALAMAEAGSAISPARTLQVHP